MEEAKKLFQMLYLQLFVQLMKSSMILEPSGV